MNDLRSTLLDHHHRLRGLNSRLCQTARRLREMTAEIMQVPDDDLESLYDQARVSCEYAASACDEAITFIHNELYGEVDAHESTD